MIKTSLHFLFCTCCFFKALLGCFVIKVLNGDEGPCREATRGGKENGQYKGSNRFHFLSKPSRETPPTDNNSASNIVSVREWGICIKRSSICLFLQSRQLKHKIVSFRHSQSLNPLDLVKGRLLKLRWQITSRFRKRTRAAKLQK